MKHQRYLLNNNNQQANTTDPLSWTKWGIILTVAVSLFTVVRACSIRGTPSTTLYARFWCGRSRLQLSRSLSTSDLTLAEKVEWFYPFILVISRDFDAQFICDILYSICQLVVSNSIDPIYWFFETRKRLIKISTNQVRYVLLSQFLL